MSAAKKLLTLVKPPAKDLPPRGIAVEKLERRARMVIATWVKRQNRLIGGKLEEAEVEALVHDLLNCMDLACALDCESKVGAKKP